MAHTPLAPHPTMVVTTPDGRTRPLWVFAPELIAARGEARRAALAAWVATTAHTIAERDAWNAYQVAYAADPMTHC